MTETLTPAVYFNRGTFLQVGPLGCFDVGEIVNLPGRGSYVVTGIQLDGLAWAYPSLADDRPKPGRDLADVLQGLGRGERSVWTDERQAAQMANVIRANRERFGLPPVEEKVAA